MACRQAVHTSVESKRDGRSGEPGEPLATEPLLTEPGDELSMHVWFAQRICGGGEQQRGGRVACFDLGQQCRENLRHMHAGQEEVAVPTDAGAAMCPDNIVRAFTWNQRPPLSFARLTKPALSHTHPSPSPSCSTHPFV